MSEVERLREIVAAYARVWWMAERYAEAGGSGGPEMRDLRDVRWTIECHVRAGLEGVAVPDGPDYEDADEATP